jgi:hypothetical protein
MKETKVKSGKSLVRDSTGRFLKGNKEGRKFQKGYAGKPKGAKNKLTLLARQLAEDVLYLDHETGKRMTHHQLCMYMKKRAHTSNRTLIFFLEHLVGKPVEQIQHRVVPTFIFPPKDKDEDAEVVEEEQFILPSPLACQWLL